VAASPPTAQVAPDLVTAPLEQFAGQTAGPGGDYQPTPDPSQEGLPHRVGLSPPLVTAAQKIAALKQTHTANAEEAAATIEAAMAAAAGAGETTGLTRRQIREAERTASEALQAASRNTGEIPSWQSYAPPATPQVRMQSSEEVEES
jgi:hypothetical protein